MLICLLLVFSSGFTSCGDDEKEDEMWVKTFVLSLDKGDTRFSELMTIFNCADAWGSFANTGRLSMYPQSFSTSVQEKYDKEK